MTTLPILPFEGHVQNLCAFLKTRVPEVESMTLLFFDRHDLKQKDGEWILPSAALKDFEAAQELFLGLCREGREWINLAGDGATLQREYLVAIEYSEVMQRPVTAVNLAGPPLNLDGSVMRYSPTIVDRNL